MIRIGTRGSQLALAQANEVRDRLIAAHEMDLQVEIEVISTKGDRVLVMGMGSGINAMAAEILW